ncbi:hypothetical protein SBC2_09720 [Caballeronia sp. SBC2]|nr:hypothetical protein SBC2_09720 [Caballeronia sp. SBC2]
MSQLHPRIAYLAEALALRHTSGQNVEGLPDLMRQRLALKRDRLHLALPSLSQAAIEAVLARSCGRRRWSTVLNTLQNLEAFTRLQPGRWSAAEVMPAAFEMSPRQSPISDAQRLFVRHFALRVTRALSLEHPSGFDLAAQLCGAADWEALTGVVPPIPPDQPLYTVAKPGDEATLVATAACGRLSGELDALTRENDAYARTYAAEHSLLQRPDFVLAGLVAAEARLELGEMAKALEHIEQCLREIEMLLAPEAVAKADGQSRISRFTVRNAGRAALKSSGLCNDGTTAFKELVSKLVASGGRGEQLIARWLTRERVWRSVVLL